MSFQWLPLDYIMVGFWHWWVATLFWVPAALAVISWLRPWERRGL